MSNPKTTDNVRITGYCGPFVDLEYIGGKFTFLIHKEPAENAYTVAAAILAQGHSERVIGVLKQWYQKKLEGEWFFPAIISAWEPTAGAKEHLEKRLIALKLAPKSFTQEEKEVVRELQSTGVIGDPRTNVALFLKGLRTRDVQ
jgi:hypothetical protein